MLIVGIDYKQYKQIHTPYNEESNSYNPINSVIIKCCFTRKTGSVSLFDI